MQGRSARPRKKPLPKSEAIQVLSWPPGDLSRGVTRGTKGSKGVVAKPYEESVQREFKLEEQHGEAEYGRMADARSKVIDGLAYLMVYHPEQAFEQIASAVSALSSSGKQKLRSYLKSPLIKGKRGRPRRENAPERLKQMAQIAWWKFVDQKSESEITKELLSRGAGFYCDQLHQNQYVFQELKAFVRHFSSDLHKAGLLPDNSNLRDVLGRQTVRRNLIQQYDLPYDSNLESVLKFATAILEARFEQVISSALNDSSRK